MHDIKIIRKEGGCAELMKMIIIEPRAEKQEIVSEKAPGYSHIRREFRCMDKFSVVSVAGEPYMLKEGDKLEFSAGQDEEIEMSCMGDGSLALICTYYNEKGGAQEEPPAAKPEPEPKEKSFASDLKLAYKIALTRFRGSTLIVRSLRKVWFDRALQRGIDRIENAYLPYILIIIGLTVIGLAGAGKIENNTLFILMGAWIALAVLFIIPLIFYAALPKPIAKHIKRIDELSEEDRQMYEEDLGENKRANKLAKRYRVTERINGKKK